MNNLECFVTNGVYVFKGEYNYLFVCLPVGNDLIGKLCQYKKSTSTMWEKTGVSYFLNCFIENDIKAIFMDRRNYEMVGQLDNNFEISNDYLLKKEKI